MISKHFRRAKAAILDIVTHTFVVKNEFFFISLITFVELKFLDKNNPAFSGCVCIHFYVFYMYISVIDGHAT